MPPVPKPASKKKARVPFPEHVARAIFDRAGGKCERCRSDEPAQIHHKLKRSQGGRDSKENCVALCLECHTWVEHHPAEATAQGWTIQRGKC